MQRIDPARWERCQQLARQLLLVGPHGEDLVRRYLDVLIDRGLPPAPEGRAPEHVLVLGAGIAGLVSAWLLERASHRVTLIEANSSRMGGWLKTFAGCSRTPSSTPRPAPCACPTSIPWCSPDRQAGLEAPALLQRRRRPRDRQQEGGPATPGPL